MWRYYTLPEEEQLGFELNPMCDTFPRIGQCFVLYNCTVYVRVEVSVVWIKT